MFFIKLILDKKIPIIKSKYEFYMQYEDTVDFFGKLFYKDFKEDNINETKILWWFR